MGFLEKIDIKNLDFENIEIIINKLGYYKKGIEKNSINDVENKLNLNKINNYILDLFEILTSKINPENIKNEYEINNYMKKIKTYQKDLSKLEQETTDEKIKNRIKELIKKCYAINLNLVEIQTYQSKKEQIKKILKKPCSNTNTILNLDGQIEYLNKFDSAKN